MLIVMRHGATDEEIQKVVAVIKEMGYQARPMPGTQRTAVGLVGNDGRVDASRLEGLAGVQEVIHVSKPYKQVSREWKGEPTVVRLGGGGGGGGVPVGGGGGGGGGAAPSAARRSWRSRAPAPSNRRSRS